MSKKILLAGLMMFLVLAPSVVVAQIGFPFGDDIGMDILRVMFGPDIPDYMVLNSDGSLSAYGILQWLIFPFFALWAVVYGIMNELNLFRNSQRITIIIALLIALIAGPTGGLVYIVRMLFLAIGSWSMIVFAAVFLAGITFWGRANLDRFGGGLLGKTWGSKEARQYLETERDIRELKAKLDYGRAHDVSPSKLEKLEVEIQNKYKKLNRLSNKITKTKKFDFK